MLWNDLVIRFLQWNGTPIHMFKKREKRNEKKTQGMTSPHAINVGAKEGSSGGSTTLEDVSRGWGGTDQERQKANWGGGGRRYRVVRKGGKREEVYPVSRERGDFGWALSLSLSFSLAQGGCRTRNQASKQGRKDMIVSHPPPTAWMRSPAKVTSALLRPPSLLPEHSSLFIHFSARSLAVRVLAHQGLSKTTLHCTALHCTARVYYLCTHRNSTLSSSWIWLLQLLFPTQHSSWSSLSSIFSISENCF